MKRQQSWMWLRVIVPAVVALMTAGQGHAEPPLSPFGLATSGEASGEYERYLPKLARLGARTLRAFGEWRRLQPTADRFDLTREDRRLAALKAHGLEASGLFLYAAPWALSDARADSKTFPTARLDAWERYVGTVVGRYGRSIRDWEVWNEPNSPAFNRGNHTPSDYANLVRVAHRAAKRANPLARVGIGVANLDVRYLRLVIESLAAQGDAQAFDFVAVHPYELLMRLREHDGEALFTSVVPNLRAMLEDAAPPTKRDVPIRFTELGVQLRADGAAPVSESDAASLLVKAYSLAIAQGVEQVNWFEIKDAGGSRGFGLLNADLSERTAYRAYGAMTDALGARPVYRGWIGLGRDRRGYGFAFSNGARGVLAAWMPSGLSDTVRFPASVRVTDIFTRRSSALAANTPYLLTDKPVFFERVPLALMKVAASNRLLGLPWEGAPLDGQVASIALGPQPVLRGLRHESAELSEPHTFADGSAGARVNVGRGDALYLTVAPAFAGYRTRDVYIRVSARTTEPLPRGRYAGMNLWYQGYAGAAQQAPQYPYKASGRWWTVPADGEWHTNTWHLSDAMFVHTFGSSFYLRVDDSVPFVIGKIELSKRPF
jgi:polysaccharide biosynthesis protein PslG